MSRSTRTHAHLTARRVFAGTDAVLAPIVADLLTRWLLPGAIVATDRAMDGQGWHPLPDLCDMPRPKFIYRT